MAGTSSLQQDDSRSQKVDLWQAQHLAPVGYWYWDPETDTATWSEGIYRISGRDPSLPALNHKQTGQFYTPESAERLERVVAEALRAGTQYELDVQIARPDGTTGGAVCEGKWGAMPLGGSLTFVGRFRTLPSGSVPRKPFGRAKKNFIGFSPLRTQLRSLTLRQDSTKG
jgi:PAS domain-containing protein